MGNSNERPGRSKEFPPTPGEGSWWEYKQGDSEPRCVIGIIDRDGKKIARILPKHVMRQYAATPDAALAQAESMPLEEFERMLKSVPKPKKGVPTNVVNAFIAALRTVEGERIPAAAPPSPSEPEKLRIFERPNYDAGDLCVVDGIELSSQFYADNIDLFYEKDGMPALPRPVIRLYSKRVGTTGEESAPRTQRIMQGTIGKGELFQLISPEEIRQLYRDEKQGLKSDTKPVAKDESVPAEKPKDTDAPISPEASRILGQAQGRLANIERTFADAESGRDGTPIFESEGVEELRGVLTEAQEMVRHMAGITDPARLDSALADLIKKTDLFDVVYTRLLKQGIKSAGRADAEPSPHPSGIPQWEEPSYMRDKEAADAQSPERQAMLDAEKAYLEKYKEFVTNKKFREKEPPELISLRQAYGAARSAYKESLDSLKYERLSDQRYTDDEIRERVKARLDRVTDPDQREKLLAYYKNPDRYRYEVSMRYDRVIRYRELFSNHAQKKINARFDALDERKKGIFVKAASWVGNQNAKLEAWAGSKTKARVVRAVASTVLVGAVAGAAGALGTMSVLAFAGWGTWRIGRVLAASTAGSVIGTGIANAGDAAFQWGARKRSGVTRQQDATGNLSDRDLEIISARQEGLSSTMDPRVRQKRKQIIAALTGLGVGMEIATLAALVPGAESLADSQPDGQRGRDATPAENRQALRERVSEVERTTQTNTSAATEQSETSRPSQPAPTEQPRATSTAPEETRVEGQTSEATDGVAVIERGEGANSMFYELQRELEARYPDPANRPVAVTRLLSESNAEGWSQALGFFRVENGEVISRIMHEGDTITVNDNGELVFHDAFANNGRGADYRLMDSRGQFNGDAIRQVEQGIPQPEQVVAPAAQVAPEVSEPVTHTPDAAPADETSAVPDTTVPPPQAEPQSTAVPIESTLQSGTETESTQATEPRAVNIEETLGGNPVVHDTTSSATSAVSIEETLRAPETQTPTATIPESGRTLQGPVSVDETLRESGASAPTPSGTESSPNEPQSVDSLVLTPETPLAAEPSAYLMSSNSNEIFVHGAGSPERNLELAKEYLRTHPTARVYFDNPKEKWLGFSYTPRVASVELDQNGNLIKMDEALDDRGRALGSVRDRLMRRIA